MKEILTKSQKDIYERELTESLKKLLGLPQRSDLLEHIELSKESYNGGSGRSLCLSMDYFYEEIWTGPSYCGCGVYCSHNRAGSSNHQQIPEDDDKTLLKMAIEYDLSPEKIEEIRKKLTA